MKRSLFLSLLLCSATCFATPKYRPIEVHGKRSIVFAGQGIELEDGSQWKVSDPSVIQSWEPNHEIIITPIFAPWSWIPTSYAYTYFLTNTQTGAYVKATLEEGAFKRDPYNPEQPNPYRHFITDIRVQEKNTFIALENNTSWQIAPDDYAIVKDWAITDAVILGVNDACFPCFLQCESILINVNMETYARATRLSNFNP